MPYTAGAVFQGAIANLCIGVSHLDISHEGSPPTQEKEGAMPSLPRTRGARDPI